VSECQQTLRFKNYEVWVHLGCSLEEQKQAQPVQFTVEIKFLKNLNGSITDQLQDAVDYVQLSEMIKSKAQSKNFQLIEHLNQQVFENLTFALKQKKILAEISLTVRKMRVPIENLMDGVEFTCQQIVS